MQHVVKATIYNRNMADFVSVNEVYGQYFRSDSPVEQSCLPRDVSIEIDFVAWKE